MENDEAVIRKDMKVEIPEVTPPTSGGGGGGGLIARQGSITKQYNCLCSPTTHAGSFRCRLHRAPTLQRTKSIESTKVTTPTQNNAVNAQ